MKTGTRIVVALVMLGVSVLAIFGVLQYVTARTTVVVTTRTIFPHEVIGEDDIREIQVHKSFREQVGLNLLPKEEIIGMHARTVIASGHMVSSEDLAEYNEWSFLLEDLAPGERLMLLTLGGSGALGQVVPRYENLIRPGDLVDLAVTTSEGKSKIFAQGVPVVSIIPISPEVTTPEQEKQPEKVAEITAEGCYLIIRVEPVLAEKILVSQATGNTLSVLFAPYNFQVVSTSGASITEMVGRDEL